MELYSQQLLDKPKDFDENSLVALLGFYDQPLTGNDPINPAYRMSELAVNEIKGLRQVFIHTPTQAGIDRFLEDYPNAIIKDDGVLENPEEWRILAYPNENMADESTPLDNLYQGRGHS